MITFLRIWWPALLVISLFILLYGYVKWERYQERLQNKKDFRIEKLELHNQNLEKANEIRKKQNEILLLDITPNDFNNILHEGRF